ncbi:hypothetical protein [Bacillus taeanensis]|jgi:hypothetical protein|nr:hypothetical protein [Bacillus taeanensis]
MRKRHGQRDAALTNNNTPTESLPHGENEYRRSSHKRPRTGPGSKG